MSPTHTRAATHALTHAHMLVGRQSKAHSSDDFSFPGKEKSRQNSRYVCLPNYIDPFTDIFDYFLIQDNGVLMFSILDKEPWKNKPNEIYKVNIL